MPAPSSVVRRSSSLRRIARRLIATAALAATQASNPAGAQEAPKYGGTLNVAGIVTYLDTGSWDPADWSWRFQHDTGLVYEQLFAADLTKSRRAGGDYAFQLDAWLPPDAIRGELAERWHWKQNPLRVEIELRKGVMFPARSGVMASRELVAQDIVDSFERLDRSPKKPTGFFDHVDKVEAVARHTVVFTFNGYNAEWDFRFGWGNYSGIVPREVADAGAGNWRNVNGSGPFMLTDYVRGSSVTFSRNPLYWGSESIGSRDYRLPFVDRITYRTIKDGATALAALRTAKIDVLEVLRPSQVEDLKRQAPRLNFRRRLGTGGTFLAMRVDTPPFDDVRVRRALNMAVNKQEIVESYYGGHAELFAYPQHPGFAGYYEPLADMPEAVRELYAYDPAKARALLAQAGYPKGFAFRVQVCSCNPDHADLLPLVAAYLEKVGVRVEIQPMELAAMLSTLATRTNAPGYFTLVSHGNPTTTLRKNFGTGQPGNPSHYSDPEFDRRLSEAFAERDEGRRQRLVKAMTRDILEKAPYIWLPAMYMYAAWWPWVKNYDGELFAGGFRSGPIHARIWIDQDLKKKAGF